MSWQSATAEDGTVTYTMEPGTDRSRLELTDTGKNDGIVVQARLSQTHSVHVLLANLSVAELTLDPGEGSIVLEIGVSHSTKLELRGRVHITSTEPNSRLTTERLVSSHVLTVGRDTSLSYGAWCNADATIASPMARFELEAGAELKAPAGELQLGKAQTYATVLPRIPGERPIVVLPDLAKIAGLRLLGTTPLDDLTLRQLEKRPEAVAAYQPRMEPDYADKPRDVAALNRRLAERLSPDPIVVANARWAEWESRRRNTMSKQVKIALLPLKALGYGLKPRTAIKSWLAMVAAVVATFWFFSDDLSLEWNGWSSVGKALLLWWEALLLPAGLLTLADDPANTELTLKGTAARTARLAVSVPFAAFVLSMRAALKLPKLSDGSV